MVRRLGLTLTAAALMVSAPLTALAQEESPASITTLKPGVLTVIYPDFPYPGYIAGEDPAAPEPSYYVDMVTEIADRLGLDVESSKADFTAMISGQFKDYDISVDSFSITPERQEMFNMTVPVASVYEGIFTKEGVPVSTADEVRNLVLGACGTCNLFKKITDEIKPVKEPRAFDIDLTKYDAVASGQIDGALGDVLVMLAKVQDPKYAGTQVACKFQPPVDFAWILPKESGLIDPVNQIIEEMRADGTLAELEAKYIVPLAGGADPAAVPDCPPFE